MNTIASVLPYVQILLSALLIAGVMLQRGGSGLGGGFGEGDNFSSAHHTRRGFEKTLFNSTIVIGIAFAVTALLAIIIK